MAHTFTTIAKLRHTAVTLMTTTREPRVSAAAIAAAMSRTTVKARNTIAKAYAAAVSSSVGARTIQKAANCAVTSEVAASEIPMLQWSRRRPPVTWVMG